MAGLDSSNPTREFCWRCWRPRRVCLCPHIQPIETTTRVVILQHPRERTVPVGTARMASLSLSNSELHVGVTFDEHHPVMRALSSETAVLLYPAADAVDVERYAGPKPVTLVVVDGTWAQARKMVRVNPALGRLPRISFTPPRPSQYRIRKEPASHCVSTIEAIMYVLGALEGPPARFEALMSPFHAMVETQLNFAEGEGHGRHRPRRPAKPPRPPLPSLLDCRYEKLVCVVGEANAWPYGSSEREGEDQDELVHWVACRVASGELFDRVARPRGALSPTTPKHVHLDPETLRGGDELSTLMDAFRAFLRDDDVVCSWGRYATRLYARSGGYLPGSRVDIRHVAREWRKTKVGTLEEFVTTLDKRGQQIPESVSGRIARGRAGLRLAQLTWVVQRFVDLLRE